jgi:UDP-N-acetylmuramate--alanine ligase
MVAEADESDGSFLKLSPVVSVITNLDREHLDHYGSFDRVLDAFVEFANKVPFYGAVVACLDDPHVRSLRPRITRRVVTYGIDTPDADLVADEIRLEPLGSRCRVRAPGLLGELQLNVPGRHNLLNALAAIGVGLELGLSFERLAGALAEFHGAERRFQVLGEAGGVTVVDDYGHHPTEIDAVVDAARAGRPGQRLVVVFQPHRYTRTRELLAEFGTALARADEVVLTDIYAASEDPLPGIDVQAVADSVRRAGGRHVHVVAALADLASAVAALVRPGDLVITLGAGSIGTVGARILDALRERAGSAEGAR